ncbi:MAG TPA: sulfur carrier protein ThiS [Candidatus Hydrogenedens sp.]|nr:sulfur carrier protein ThiS [Candidatus Hydrogenedens sp.]
MIKVTINDEEKMYSDMTTIDVMLKEMNLEGKTVVVVVNDEIVEHTQYAETVLKDGDRIDLVRIVGGG